MKFVSTCGTLEPVSFEYTLKHAIPSEKNLWMPESIPVVNFSECKSLKDFINTIMNAFVPEIWTVDMLDDFIMPIKVEEKTFRRRTVQELQLFHGPTEAFKDVGTQVAAKIYGKLFDKNNYRVVVATSGDTGGAVASAFAKTNGIPVTILFPEGKISLYQEEQITKVNDPYFRILALSIYGNFDDCQKLAKKLLSSSPNLLSSNSISLARLLPQIAYHAWVASKYPNSTLVIPSGNMGNVVSAMMAKRMSAPITSIHIACNANDAVVRYINARDSLYIPKKTVETPASAMDVGSPSNMIRILYLDPTCKSLSASSTTTKSILDITKEMGVCPHTATAYDASIYLPYTSNIIVLATASPKKFQKNKQSGLNYHCTCLRQTKLYIANPLVVYIVGLPCSGKETLSRALNGQVWKDKTEEEILSSENMTGVIALPPYVVLNEKVMLFLRSQPRSVVVFLHLEYTSIESRMKNRKDYIFENLHFYDLIARFARHFMAFSDYKISTDRHTIDDCVTILKKIGCV